MEKKKYSKDYVTVRKDLMEYLHTNSMTKAKFCEENGCSTASLYRFLTGNLRQSGNVMDVAIKVLYGDENPEEKESEIEENIVTDDTLDEAIMKLLDKKIEEVCKKINSLESDLKKLQDSKDIIKKLLG